MVLCDQIRYLRGVVVSEEWPSRVLDEICRLLKSGLLHKLDKYLLREQPTCYEW